MSDKQMITELQKHFDTNQYGLGRTKFIEIREQLGLLHTRKQGHTPESIREVMIKLREAYPNAGIRDMISLLFHEYQLSVSRRVVETYFVTYEAHLIRQRKARRLQRRRFWAAGVNDIWAVDQHDKWLHFGLVLHTGIEPFSGRILWIKVWHSNRNPQLILSYYLETISDFGCAYNSNGGDNSHHTDSPNLTDIPMVTQSDPGTENFGIANAQTMLRQMHDPSLAGFVQHRWMRTKKNIMPEIAWSQLRKRFTPGFEDLLNQGVDAGWYDPDNTLQLMLFRWLFIPWIQNELDRYKHHINNTRKRRDRNTILPHGVPMMIHTSAEDYGALDFKYAANRLQYHGKQLNITLIDECYALLGLPAVHRCSIWTIYLQLLEHLQERAELPPMLINVDDRSASNVNDLPLLGGLADLPDNDYYMGGVGSGRGLQEEHMHALDVLERDNEPQLDDTGNDGDTFGTASGPSLWVDRFSDTESEVDDDLDAMA
ncbi:hypothetical protein JVT61DRAFT_7616 [Boletus reticuloceps]|uniref:Uncharacterized protein n=1 Tax=Boletus reticuloceps TaxID=495285 RepID=A0A8I2YIJ7_9AGAM|nr:hypothetical protein JVT61DRAFT_7616 [Boletus reticuloceps]